MSATVAAPHLGLVGGLVGTSGTLPPERLAAALRAAPYRGPVTAEWMGRGGGLWALGSASLVLVDGLLVGLHGRLHNDHELAAVLGCRPEPGDVIAAAYRRWGTSCVDRLRGDFAALLLEPDSGTLIGLRDWMGTMPLFHRRDCGVVVAASEPAQLLGAARGPVGLDLVTIETFQTLEGLAVGRTFYDELLAVAPNGWVAASAGRVRTGEVPVVVPRLQVDMPEAVRETRRLLDQAVIRRLKAPLTTVSCVSGGMDSTTVAAVAHTQLKNRGAQLSAGYCFSFPEVPECDETDFARAVCDRMGVPLRLIPIHPADLAGRWADAAQQNSGPVFGTGVLMLDLIEQAAADGAQLLLTGHGGDHWFGPAVDMLAESLLHCDLGFVRVIIREGLRPEHTLRPLVRALPASLLGSRAGLKGRPAPGRRTGWGRLAAEVEERAGARRGLLVVAPLYDRELATFSAGLPPRLHTTAHATKVLLRQTMSDLLPKEVLCRQDKTQFSAVLHQGLRSGRPDQALRRAHQEAMAQWLTTT